MLRFTRGGENIYHNIKKRLQIFNCLEQINRKVIMINQVQISTSHNLQKSSVIHLNSLYDLLSLANTNTALHTIFL